MVVSISSSQLGENYELSVCGMVAPQGRWSFVDSLSRVGVDGGGGGGGGGGGVTGYLHVK